MRYVFSASLVAAAVLATAACDPGVPAIKPGEFLISTLAAPPGRSVERSFGFYCRWFTHAAGADYAKGLTGANVALKTEGEKLGANAFLNLSVAAVPAGDAKGGGGTLVTLCGDFVQIR